MWLRSRIHMVEAEENYKDPDTLGHIVDLLGMAEVPKGIVPEGRSPA